MNISAILLAMVVVGGTGLLIAILLGIASEKFKVPVDEKEVAIRAELPGNNCGGCGYAGCDGLAKAIANGEAPVNGCPVGGAAAAEKISAIMGVEAGEFVKKVAFVKCAGTCEKASDKYQYSGVQSCIEAMNVPGAGPKGCEFGCMGFGSCAAVCPENAISIVNGIAHIDEEACVGCGKCAETCPKALIDLVPENKKTRVQCSSKEFGKNVMSVCKAGCIGCKACEKVCRLGAIKVENNIAQIDYDKCVSCGMCLVNCPFGAISDKSQIYQVIKAIQSGEKVYAAVAPAFVGQFGPKVTTEKLRAAMKEACDKNGITFYHPSPIFCTDNAAMIGVAAYYEYIKGNRSGWDLNAVPNLKLGER